MPVTLNPAAEQVIKTMGIQNDAVATQIETVIGKYSKPKTFSEALSYVVHLIVNAVKSLFGKSAWQIALKDLAEATLDTIKDNGQFNYNPETNDKKQKEINSKIEAQTKSAVADWLKRALEAQNNGENIKKNDLKKMGFNQLVIDIQENLKEKEHKQKVS